jgi:hypothetical protein
VIAAQLGRPPRGTPAVAARCPYGRPAVIEQPAYLADGTPFPTTYFLTCPHAVARIGAIESAGGVDRYERLVAEDATVATEYRDGAARQRALRRPAVRMADAGESLGLGVGGTGRAGAVKCLHAHAAFALADPGYALGRRILAEAEPLFPAGECCTP